MTEPDPLLDRAAIEDAFRRLGDRLARRGVVADIYVFGGAAMALAYDARRSTRDIDAVFIKEHGLVQDEARAVADELGLPRWWLNEQASAYVAPGVMPLPDVFSTIRDFACQLPPEHLLAMKVLAARRRDAEDISFLVKHLGLSSAAEAWPCARKSFRTNLCRTARGSFLKTCSATVDVVLARRFVFFCAIRPLGRARPLSRRRRCPARPGRACRWRW